MRSIASTLCVLISSLSVILAHPPPEPTTVPTQYTLTAYAPNNRTLNGLKVQWGGALNLFQAQVASYCPDQVRQSGGCPNGTETVFSGSLHPLSTVPGGQDLYVTYNGLIQITTQHSHSYPPNSFPYYIGWTWTPLPQRGRRLRRCPHNHPLYNCDVPGGTWNFMAPGAVKGGVMACPNEYNPAATSVYAVTPGFERGDCTALEGLGTYEYSGVSPPVWAY